MSMCHIREEAQEAAMGLRTTRGTQTRKTRVYTHRGVGAAAWPRQQDAGRQRDSFHQIKLANSLPCRTGIVIQTLCH